jgi:hypothetical protein
MIELTIECVFQKTVLTMECVPDDSTHNRVCVPEDSTHNIVYQKTDLTITCVFQKTVLTKIFASVREDIKSKYNMELRDKCLSQNIISVIKSRRMR